MQTDIFNKLQIMKENKETQNTEIGDVISKTENFIEKNKRILVGAICAILVIVVAIFGYRACNENHNNEAADVIFPAQQWFGQDSLQLALKGNAQHPGFEQIADDYSSTKIGNLAKYYAGICNLRLGNYQAAIDYFEDYSGKDVMTSVTSIILTGDAYLELGNDNKALSCYEKAAKNSDDDINTPMALFKAGMIYMIQNNEKAALEKFNAIKTEYPASTEARSIDKYIGYAESAE